MVLNTLVLAFSMRSFLLLLVESFPDLTELLKRVNMCPYTNNTKITEERNEELERL